MYRVFFLLSWLLAVTTGAASAETLAQPSGEVILSISGEIAQTNSDATAEFDLAMLEALPSGTYETSTIWTEGTKTFVGVPLMALLEAVEADGTAVLASAINDYTVEIPIDSITADVPLIAYHMDGETMSRRQKGPLWIVYPFDSASEYRSEVVYSRSIWQLDRLKIVK